MTLDRRVSASDLIEQARIRDARFFDLKLPDGALLLYLNTKQRTLLLQLSDAIQPLIGTSESISTTFNGALVGFDGENANTPYYLTTAGTGYPVMFANSTPYVDTTVLPIAFDPFGVNGGTPGFPLPVDMIKLFGVQATFQDGSTSDVDVIPERSRQQNPAYNVSAFINHNRLVPVRTGVAPYTDYWNQVTALSASFIAMEYLHALSDKLNLPTEMHECLISGLSAYLSTSVPSMSAGEKKGFQETAKMAEDDLLAIGRDMVGQITEHSVIFRG